MYKSFLAICAQAMTWLALAFAVATLSGCGLLAQQTEKPRPSETIKGFLQQPRAGNGVIGP